MSDLSASADVYAAAGGGRGGQGGGGGLPHGAAAAGAASRAGRLRGDGGVVRGVEGWESLPQATWTSFRLMMGAGTAVAIALLIASLNLAWWHYSAVLKAPTFDGGITQSNGGVGLTWRQHCENYADTSYADGTPLLARQLCVVQELDLSSPTRADLDGRNRQTLVVYGFSVAFCAVVLYLLAFAPAKRPVWAMMSHVVYAPTLDRLAAPSWSHRALWHATYWHDWACTLLPLEYFIPLLLLPTTVAIIVYAGQYSQDAGALPDYQFVAAQSLYNINCTALAKSCTSFVGRGLTAGLGAAIVMLIVSMASVSTIIIPRCLPCLLAGAQEVTTAGAESGLAESGEAGVPHAQATGSAAVGTRTAIQSLVSQLSVDGDDDDEDGLFLPRAKLLVLPHERPSSSGTASSPSAPLTPSATQGAGVRSLPAGSSVAPLFTDATAGGGRTSIGASFSEREAGPRREWSSRAAVAGFIPLPTTSLSSAPLVAGAAALATSSHTASATLGEAAMVEEGGNPAAAEGEDVGGAMDAVWSHPSLLISQGALLLFRTGITISLAMLLATFGIYWWVYSAGATPTGETLWTGGLLLSQFAAHAAVGRQYTFLVNYDNGISPITAFAVPTNVATALVVFAVLIHMLQYALALPYENVIIRGLWYDFLTPVARWSAGTCCRCCPRSGASERQASHQESLLSEAEGALPNRADQSAGKAHPAIQRLLALSRYANASCLLCCIAGLVMSITCLKFNWGPFLYQYVDLLHEPNSPASDTIGPGLILVLVSAAIQLLLGQLAACMVTRRQALLQRLQEEGALHPSSELMGTGQSVRPDLPTLHDA